MKRVFAFFFCALLAGQVWAQTTFEVGNLRYTIIDKDNHVSVGVGSTEPSDELYIPKSVTNPDDGEDYYVASVEDNAFFECHRLTSIKIECDADFSHSGLHFEKDGVKYFVLDQSSVMVGTNFITWDGYTIDIDTYAADDPAMQTIVCLIQQEGSGTVSPEIVNLVIPSTIEWGETFTVTSFSSVALSVRNELVSISLPESITHIGYKAFTTCEQLQSITIESNADFSNSDLCFTDNKDAMMYKVLSKNSVEIVDGGNSSDNLIIESEVTCGGPFSIISIGDYAFADCEGLVSVSIPESVTSIGENAFSGVESVSYSGTAEGAPWGANEIIGSSGGGGGTEVFFEVDNLRYYIIDEENHYVSVAAADRENVSANLEILSKVIYNDEEYIVTSIRKDAFSNCNITSVFIPETITSIGNCAFRDCGNLTSVTIPNSVTNIGAEAFSGCTNMKSIYIPKSVTIIGTDAFGRYYMEGQAYSGSPWGYAETDIDERCPIETLTYNTNAIGQTFKGFQSLKTVNIGGAVTEIAAGAFGGCSGLTSVTIPNSVTSIGLGAFGGEVEEYYEDEYGRLFLMTIYDFGEECPIETLTYNTNAIGQTFKGFKSLKTVNIGNAVTRIDGGAFRDCSGLTSITIPETVTNVGKNAFDGCDNLTSITINTDADVSNSGLSLYKDGIYYSVLTKNTVSAFNHRCRNSVVLPSKVTAGDEFTVTTISFTKYSPTITSLTIPNTITKIDQGALGVFDNLESVTIESDCDLSNAGLSFKKDGISYEVLSKSTAKLVNGRNCSGDLVIPDTIDVGNDFAVTSIGVSAFLYCGNLTSITLPKSLTRIGGSAFGFCENLNSITLPEKLTSIEDEAFADCINLSSITIPESVINIGDKAFEMCSGIKSITYNSDYVGSLFRYLFYYAGHNIQTVNIGDAVTRIDDGAFGICPNLTSITIPEQITYVGENAFDNCENLTSVTIETNADVSNAGLSFTKDDIGYSVLSRNSAILTDGASFSGDLVIPEKVIAGNTFAIMGIGEQAFANNTNITSVTLPEWVTSIGDGAFSGCNNIATLTYNTDAVGALFSGIQSLKTVNIGDAVTRLEDGAFAGCKYLENVSVGNGIESVGNNVFDGCNFLDYNIYSNGYYLGNSQNPNMILMSARNKSITSCTVSADCRFICDGAFRDCKKLAEVVLPESLTYVNNGLFSGCGSLRAVAIPESVKAIGNDAFKGCSSLTEIKIPESVTTIGSNAFAGCSGITALTIPNRVTSVSNNAFDGCTSLETVIIGKSVAEFSSGIFANCSGLDRIICYAETPIRLEDDPFIFSDTIYVPATSVDAYKAATIWKRKDIMPFYKVKILSANGEFGTAEGDTLILGNHTATLTATAFDGYHFARWSDNNTESPRALAATKDTVLTAFFEAHTTVTDFAVAATCEAFGLTEGSHCPGCGHVFVKQDTLPATGHTEVKDFAVAPTCTVKGKTEGSHCSVCNAVLVAQNDIAALGHKEVTDAAVAPTCTKTGLTAGKHCIVCEAVTVEQAEVPALGHKEVVDAAVAPTCTESGLTEGKHCSVCDAVIVAQKMVLALGHKEVIDAGKAATCTESGITEGKHCSVCNAVLKEQTEIAALGHVEVVDAAIQATCTEPGLTEGKHCSVCRFVIKAQEVVPALGHTVVVDSAVAPACTEPGLTEGSHCSVCNAVIVPQVKIPMLKHDIVLDSAVAATATTDGLTEGLHCSICGEVFHAQQVIPALGEQPGENENQGGSEQGNENQGGNENQEGNENQNTNPGTAVSEQIAELCIHAHHNIIVVENAEAEIRVYDAMGRLVGRDAINRVRAEIRVNVAGIYIVRVGSVAKRVMIND